ncbi:hypothetical protein BC830DRAFT_1068266 [Chytriomyces sp. MP71]|nr:hypothetical protein BC830DRAFT_1068266 [Chytriomyces sp. MP71]
MTNDPTILNLPVDVKYVRLYYPCTSNIPRAKLFTRAQFQSRIVFKGQGFTSATLSMPFLYDANFSSLPMEELQLIPDMRTLRMLPHAHGHAVVLGRFVRQDGTPAALDPRGFLERAVERLESEFGVRVRAGFESEVVLLKEAAEVGVVRPVGGSSVDEGARRVLVPVDACVYADMNALNNGDTVAVLEGIVNSLEAMDIEVQQFHPESATGQFEIVTGYKDVLEAVDDLVHTRVVVRGVAATKGYVATLAPKVFPMQAGSASHVHLSIWDKLGLQNLFPAQGKEHGISDLGRYFMAGILHHLPALQALTTPTPMSHARTQPGCWSGAYQCWGVENKESALRLVHDASRFEFKTLDATANPYLALGAILYAGMDGIRKQLALPAPINVDPMTLSGEKAPKRLASTVGEALDLLKADAVLREAMGTKLMDNFVEVKEKESISVAGMDAEVVRRIMVERY